jgi:S-adenosylmethionine hydrolase
VTTPAAGDPVTTGPATITFTTDYGLADGFAAACHGVAATLVPSVRLIDITHLVPAGDIRRGALVLAQTAPAMPPGAVHVAVVDPGVGTARRAIAIQAGESMLVGPDNGLLIPAADALGGVTAAAELTDPRYFRTSVSDVPRPRRVHPRSRPPRSRRSPRCVRARRGGR